MTLVVFYDRKNGFYLFNKMIEYLYIYIYIEMYCIIIDIWVSHTPFK